LRGSKSVHFFWIVWSYMYDRVCY